MKENLHRGEFISSRNPPSWRLLCRRLYFASPAKRTPLCTTVAIGDCRASYLNKDSIFQLQLTEIELYIERVNVWLSLIVTTLRGVGTRKCATWTHDSYGISLLSARFYSDDVRRTATANKTSADAHSISASYEIYWRQSNQMEAFQGSGVGEPGRSSDCYVGAVDQIVNTVSGIQRLWFWLQYRALITLLKCYDCLCLCVCQWTFFRYYFCDRWTPRSTPPRIRFMPWNLLHAHLQQCGQLTHDSIWRLRSKPD